jgi:transposase
VATLHQLSISVGERETLEGFCRKGTAEQRTVCRARIILALAGGQSCRATARELGLVRNTVRKWRGRFVRDRLTGLCDQPRSGRPPAFTATARTQIIGLACRAPRDEGCSRDERWTLDLLVETAVAQEIVPAIHRATIGRLLTQGEIKPHRWRMWLHSQDPAFKERINDIVRLYLERQLDEVVLCIDEKTGIQALERKFPDRAPAPRRHGRREFEYIRHGTLSLFAAREVHSGQVFGWCAPARGRAEFLTFMDQLAAHYPNRRVQCVLDNLNTHLGPVVDAWLAQQNDRFVFHFTPIHGSWVNQIEVWFSILGRRLLRQASFTSTADLERRIIDFITHYNACAGPFKWTWKGYPLMA